MRVKTCGGGHNLKISRPVRTEARTHIFMQRLVEIQSNGSQNVKQNRSTENFRLAIIEFSENAESTQQSRNIQMVLDLKHELCFSPI